MAGQPSTADDQVSAAMEPMMTVQVTVTVITLIGGMIMVVALIAYGITQVGR